MVTHLKNAASGVWVILVLCLTGASNSAWAGNSSRIVPGTQPLVVSPNQPMPSVAIPPEIAGHHADSPSLLFRGEFSKPEVYAGEQVMVNFMVYAQEDVLDIEVAKFPEFRGYWSENFSLRQGPIPLTAVGLTGNRFETNWKRASIGSYLLTPMVGKPNPTLEPMKIIVRRGTEPVDNNSDQIRGDSYNCAYEPLKIKPLPPLPSDLDRSHFINAVGNFTVSSETPEVPFQKDEPVSLRITLQGEGNFQEMNQLPLPTIPSVEVISSHSTISGSGQFTRKTYDTTVTVHSDQDFTLPTFPLIYFNPQLGHYVGLTVPPMAFHFVPTPPANREEEHPELFSHPPDAQWTAYRPWYQSALFWVMQIGLLVGSVVLVAAKLIPERQRKRREHPNYLRKRRWDAALTEYQSGNVEGFLRLADALALECLIAHAELPNGLTRMRALTAAQKALDAEILLHARKIFEAYEALSFSPAKQTPRDLPALEKSLEQLMQSLLTSKSSRRAA